MSKRRDYQWRNFGFALLQGTFMRINLAFVDSSTVLSAFIYKLTGSNIMVGLASFIDDSRLDVAPTVGVKLAGASPAQNAILRTRYEYTGVCMACNILLYHPNQCAKPNFTHWMFLRIIFPVLVCHGGINTALHGYCF